MKKGYEKPKVTRVALKPEEAVLTACKTNSSSGPRQTLCNSGGATCSQTPTS
jgi:hypothetical protein